MNYLKHLRLDLERAVRVAKFEIYVLKMKLELYQYTETERAEVDKELQSWENDVRHYSKQLAEMGGAENEEPILTESKLDSESPRFTGITCTTVL